MSISYTLKAVIGIALAILLLILVLRPDDEWQSRRLLEFAADSCRNWEQHSAPSPVESVTPAEVTEILFRGNPIGKRHRLPLADERLLLFEVIAPGVEPRRFVASLFDAADRPLLLVALNRQCELQVARRVDYAANGQALSVSTLDENLAPRGDPEWLNPPLPPGSAEQLPAATEKLRVAMVDSGVNYLLPEIGRRLARDEEGGILGYDFWDMDSQPFDAHPVDSGFFVQRHGTRTASLLLREAPAVELIPYRYPRPEMSRMRELVEHAAAHEVAIVGMPLGGNLAAEWVAFEAAARAHPQILFVVSAGNNGRDIDEQPVYPAALDLANMIVVTSADDFLRPAERTNWGRESVDFLVPAENVDATDFSGEAVRVAGSSYAVARLTALAARIKASRPELDASGIVDELRRGWTYSNDTTRRWVAAGYIADPLAGGAIERKPLTLPGPIESDVSRGRPLSLELLVLDAGWETPRIAEILDQAYAILAQCGITRGALTAAAIEGPDYLKDLSTGSARTLFEALAGDGVRVVLARDTRMLAAYTGEAFGLGNTRMRPWLANSVWLMLDVDDPGIALAHELYHVIANSGAHVEGEANLMQARTRPESTELSEEQCSLALENGAGNGLLAD